MINLIGQTFGKWKVIGEAKRRRTFRYWICRCECGREQEVYQGALRRKNNPSRSCLECRKTKATHNLAGIRHPLYICWQNMKRRCFDSTHQYYSRYGGRGITVCEEWLDSNAFISWAKPRWAKGLQLDRIDNEGNYEPSNCRFVTPLENARNK